MRCVQIVSIHGTIYVEWDHTADPPRPRYFGYGVINGVRVSLHGDREHIPNSFSKRVKLTITPNLRQGKPK